MATDQFDVSIVKSALSLHLMLYMYKFCLLVMNKQMVQHSLCSQQVRSGVGFGEGKCRLVERYFVFLKIK